MDIDAREPRPRLIGRFVENCLNGSIEKQAAYAWAVRQCYESQHPDPDDRLIKFPSIVGDAIRDQRETRQAVMRRLRGEIKFEADFEEAAVLALPPEPRRELLRLLAARYGLLPVPVPNERGLTAADLARVTEEIGQMFSAYSPLLVDGVINSRDSLHHLIEGLEQTDDVLAVVTCFRVALQNAIDERRRGRGV